MPEKKDSLGDRIKTQYEDRYRIMLPRRTYTIIRVDGKAFHSLFDSSFKKPFDETIIRAMNAVAIALCEQIQGAKLAYVQSDEVSVLVTDFDKISTSAWFDGNLQKIVSVSAAIATATFDEEIHPLTAHLGLFDARAFVIPDPVEVENYFIWRQKDARRNSIQSVAQAHFSAGQLHGKNIYQQLVMLGEKSILWEAQFSTREKHGAAIVKGVWSDDSSSFWSMHNETPIFTHDRKFLTEQIPRQWAEDK